MNRLRGDETDSESTHAPEPSRCAVRHQHSPSRVRMSSLVVEDDLLIGPLLAEVLEDLGHIVVAVEIDADAAVGGGSDALPRPVDRRSSWASAAASRRYWSLSPPLALCHRPPSAQDAFLCADGPHRRLARAGRRSRRHQPGRNYASLSAVARVRWNGRRPIPRNHGENSRLTKIPKTRRVAGGGRSPGKPVSRCDPP
jgi:hypothetical protein